MRLIDDAGFVLRRAWSIRLIAAAAILSGLEVGFQVVTAFTVSLPVPPGLFAALSGMVTVAAFVARFIAQKREGAE